MMALVDSYSIVFDLSNVYKKYFDIIEVYKNSILIDVIRYERHTKTLFTYSYKLKNEEIDYLKTLIDAQRSGH